MEKHISMTPFGRRSMTLGMISSQMETKAMPEDLTVHKWHVFQNIKEARIVLGATDRALAILNALLSFHPDTALYSDGELIVWPSNEQLIGRANGMSPATLRRHLANLVKCGLIIRRDSPNGKRFARKGSEGEIEQAFGFDISPIVARASEFLELAETMRAEKKAYKLAKEWLTIVRRDVVKLIDTGIEEAVPGNWGGVQLTYMSIVAKIPRTAPRQVLESIATELDELRSEVREILEHFIKSSNLSANESQNERHIQNSKPESKNESERSFRDNEEESGSVADKDNVRSLPHRELPLGIVLDACPNMKWMVKGGGEIRNWREFLAAAEISRPMLGISQSAWSEARTAMGEQQAAITVASIYQRSDQIKSPGGYLRNLTERAREGKFSVWPMVMALLRAKLEASKKTTGDANTDDLKLEEAERMVRTDVRLEVSDALRQSLEKKGRGVFRRGIRPPFSG